MMTEIGCVLTVLEIELGLIIEVNVKNAMMQFLIVQNVNLMELVVNVEQGFSSL
jgi:hypothetical protein